MSLLVDRGRAIDLKLLLAGLLLYRSGKQNENIVYLKQKQYPWSA